MGLLLVGSIGGIAAAALSLISGGSLLGAVLIYFGVGHACVFGAIGACALRTYLARPEKPVTTG